MYINIGVTFSIHTGQFVKRLFHVLNFDLIDRAKYWFCILHNNSSVSTIQYDIDFKLHTELLPLYYIF